jgi:diguanylate cyclase (GGDEF)-like protein/PAS domain S-box-containing protein
VHTVETGEPTVFEGISYDHEPTQASRRYDISAVRVGDGVSMSFRDVTERYQEAERLAASERRYRMLAENASDIVYWADQHGRILWISPAVTRVLGWSVEELLGRVGTDLIHPDDRPRTDSLRAPFYDPEAAADLEPATTILRARTRDGSYRWMSAMLTQGRSEDGEILGAVGTWHDIDDLVRAQESERRTQMSLDEAAAAVMRVDTTGMLRYANPRAVKLLGLRTSSDVFLGSLFVDGGKDEFQRCLERLRGGAATHQQVRLCAALPDGRRVWCDVYLSPIRGERGDGLSEVLVQMADVTEEVTSRQALIVSSEHFRLLAENASDVVYETAPDGVIRWMSPSAEQALDWPPGVLIGMNEVDLVHPDDLTAVMPLRTRVYQDGTTAEIVVRFRTLTGSWRWMSVRARPLLDHAGQVTGAVIGLRDVTDETTMARRLERSERTFRTAMEEAPQGMALADLQDQVTQVNPALARILGEPREGVLGRHLAEFYVRTDPNRPTCAQSLLESGDSQMPAHEHQLLAGDPLPRWVSHSVSLIRDADGTPSFFVHHVVDVTRSKRREEDLGYRASHDLLTHLLNREGLMDRLEDWLPLSEGSGGVALLFADLDGLKAINDEHGHAAGDEVIIEVARRLERSVRRGDVVARISGDEFVVLLDRIQTPEAAAVVAENARQGVTGPVTVSGVEVPVTVSIGVASARPGESAADLLARADAALYRAKQAGRNQVSR